MDEARRRAARDAYKRQQREAAWGALGLSRAELDALYDAVDRQLRLHGCDHSTRFTERWAQSYGHDWESLREALADAGGYCDCEVMMNTDPDQ